MRERKRQRMEGYDYSTPGAYFVTICVHGWVEVFGEVCAGNAETVNPVGNGLKPFPTGFAPVMVLNEPGKIAEYCWLDLPNHYPNCRLDVFVIMPNHVHGVVWVVDGLSVGNGLKPFPTDNPFPPLNPFPRINAEAQNGTKRHGLPEFMRGFKTFSSRRINELNPDNRFQWQKSYHDRIVRDEAELNRIRKYIIENPENWFKEREIGILQSDADLFGPDEF